MTASAVVAAVQAYSKINSAGQWVDRSEHVNLTELFNRMTTEEMESYAKDGILPCWFEATVGGALWWDAHFISLDYGFGKSSASAHLHVRTQDGKIKTIGEFVAPHLPAYEFAGEVVRRFVAPTTDKGNRRKILAVYLDPSNFKNIGDGHTIADQISEVLEPYDLSCIPASNDLAWWVAVDVSDAAEWKMADRGYMPETNRSHSQPHA